ncbi:MAG: histidine kinase dimerization/phospho-acceptor domain-containing protein, partial [Vicinamibacterales bacterium]
MFPPIYRRFLWPQLLIIAAAALAVLISAGFAIGHASADDAAFGRHIFPVIWVAIAGVVIACIVSALLASRTAKQQIAETQQMLLDAVPAALARRPSLSQVDDQVLHDIAGTFSELMQEGSKDQAQLLTIISSMSDGLIATDHQQRILLTNDAAHELMDFRIPEARGKQLWEIVPIEEVLKTVTEVSLTGQRKTISLGPVNGKYLEVTICRLPLRPAGFIIVAHDVTETMRYEELRKEFVANVSHELRTPLSVIKGYVETLKDGAFDDRERAIKFLGTIERHTDQLTNLVDDLLSLSRLDSTPGVPSPRAVHLGRVATKV